ncbi:formimidoylglutamase [Brachybacterium subflavum]|uniref:formimidoylglutamase n=1 Tax=Brachybacterium subflavum TaxID=2585206 RepID=UPI0012661D27|nr:formimidoylglutamase [Brachybacterium subflavum]
MTRSPGEDDAPVWTGRRDGEGPQHARWHQSVHVRDGAAGGAGTTGDGEAGGPRSGSPHVALLGFRSDAGVRRNRGRVGAADGPAALRRALAPMALHGPLAAGEVDLVDLGDAETIGEDLESGQEAAAALTARALDDPGARLVVVLGGGHETAWASYRGLMDSRLGPASGRRWGVLNLDAHFDLREEEVPTSGTPFAQMAAAERSAGRDLRYAVVGIAGPSNTSALFAAAREIGARWMSDLECLEQGAAGIRDFVEDFTADLDVLYLTIDLDLMPAANAPGVSAPAGLGVPVPLVIAAVQAAASSGKLALVDVVELNPRLDIDSRTARTAARLIDEAVRGAVGG